MITGKALAGLCLGVITVAVLPHAAAADVLTSASSLDDTDKQDRQDAIDHLLAAPAGDEETWSNIDSGHHGAVRSLSERPGGNGETCRDIAETVWLFDGQESGTIVACRSGAEPWRIVSSSLKAPPPAPAPANATSQPNGFGNLPVQVWIGAPRDAAGTTAITPPSGIVVQPNAGQTP